MPRDVGLTWEISWIFPKTCFRGTGKGGKCSIGGGFTSESDLIDCIGSHSVKRTVVAASPPDRAANHF